MNLFLRPLSDPNGVTWSVIWMLIILLVGVFYYIYTIMNMAFQEMEDESNQPKRRRPRSTDSTPDTSG